MTTKLVCKCGSGSCKAVIEFSEGNTIHFTTNEGVGGEITLDANDLVDLINAARKELLALTMEA